MAVRVVRGSIKTTALVLLSSAFASNCIFAKKEAQLTENPKTTIVQSDSMATEAQNIKRKNVGNAVPTKIDTTLRKDADYYVNTLKERGWVELPEEDVWMANEIKYKLGIQGYVVDIGPPTPGIGVMLRIVGTVR